LVSILLIEVIMRRRKHKPRGVVYQKYNPPGFRRLEDSDGGFRRDELVYASVGVDVGTHNCSAPDKNRYTGTLVKGIGTLHKSNLVPIINEQEAKDIANMRRN
jgi:hypothetical protein